MRELGHVDIPGLLTGELGAQTPTLTAHLASCSLCREEVESLRAARDVLVAVPPELLLDGAPPDADLLLQRTLRRVRREAAGGLRRTRVLAAAAAVVLVAAAMATGVLVGRSGPEAVALPPPAAGASAPAPGTRFASATDPATGARLAVGVAPAAGWVQLSAAVTGIPAGQRCRLVAVGTDGTRQIAGNWLVSAALAENGVHLEGSALVDQADLAAVLVENEAGYRFVQVVF
jgi:hypothetical protein